MNMAPRDSSLHSPGGDSHETEKTADRIYFGQDKEGEKEVSVESCHRKKNSRGKGIGAKSRLECG